MPQIYRFRHNKIKIRSKYLFFIQNRTIFVAINTASMYLLAKRPVVFPKSSASPSPTPPKIGVFKTNIGKRQEANRVCNQLKTDGLVTRATVDLSDCDHILRTVSNKNNLVEIILAVQRMGFFIEELPD